MSSKTCRVLAFALVIPFGLAGAALAQGAQPERTWTDPPARAAVPSAPAAVKGKDETSPAPTSAGAAPRAAADPATPAMTPRIKAASRQRPGSRARVATRSGPANRRAYRSYATRAPTVRMQQPSVSPRAAMVRYGTVEEPYPVGRVGESFADDRVRRIRQAQESGYLVVRARDLRAIQDRRLEVDRPAVFDDPDD